MFSYLNRLITTKFSILLISLLGTTPAIAAEPDWRDYEVLLQRYVSRGTVEGVELNQVDYAGLSRDPAFVTVVAQLAAFPLERLNGHAETLAFYINAYNILALKVVADHWPVDSIKDIGSFFRPVWKRPAGTLGGREVTLDEIEHDRLRKMDEPRIHLAIVCASVSCPDLRLEAYTAGRLDGQLEAQCVDFLSNPSKGLRSSGERAEISRIFKWFDQDFAQHGGVETFIRRYVSLPEGTIFRASLDYNWSVNGK